MELLIENIKSTTDQKLLLELATRLGLRANLYDAKKEDAALAKAMTKAAQGKMLSKKEALNLLGE